MKTLPLFRPDRARRPLRRETLILCCALGLLRTSVDAQSPAYEGFRPENAYHEGSLAEQNPTGQPDWQGKWSLPKTGPSQAYRYDSKAALTSTALTYPGGGGVEITPGDDGVHEIGRKLAKTIPAKGNQAIYVSFLLSVSEKTSAGIAYVFFTSIGGIGAGIQGGNLMVLARHDGGMNDEGQPVKEWSPVLNNEYQPGTTYLFVLKAGAGEDEWAATDEMEVWINPLDVSSESAGSTNAHVYNNDSAGNIIAPSGSINQVVLHVENLKGVTVRFDELRVGTTWDSVTGPVGP